MDYEVVFISLRRSRDAKAVTERERVMQGEQGLLKSHLPVNKLRHEKVLVPNIPLQRGLSLLHNLALLSILGRPARYNM